MWISVSSSPVCFGARNSQSGTFSAPVAGSLVAVKLVHQFGYVTCDKARGTHYSFWGCGENTFRGLNKLVATVITNSINAILMPPDKFATDIGGFKWYKVPGYNSQSPEIVLSSFSHTRVNRGEELRLWYSEDLANKSEVDNDGRVCYKVYVMYS